MVSTMGWIRLKSAIEMVPICDLLTKVADRSGTFALLWPKLMPFRMSPVTWNMYPSPSDSVSMKIAWWLRGAPILSTK